MSSTKHPSLWSHFWRGFWRGLAGWSVPSPYVMTMRAKPLKTISRARVGASGIESDLGSCFEAVGSDMRKVMADFDRVLQRELKNHASGADSATVRDK